MYVGSTPSTMAACYTACAAKRDPVTAKINGEPADQGGGTDLVTISEEARRIAEAERPLTRPPIDGASGTYPLEMYAVPEWITTYYPQGNRELGSSANWLAENHPEMASATRDERAEYYTLIKGHYAAVLEEHGIDSVPEHYDAMIADKASSEALRQEFETRMDADDRLSFLMRKLGMGPFRRT